MAQVAVACVFAMVSAGHAEPPATDFIVSPDLSAATFTVFKWTVLKEQGTFKAVNGRLHYDPSRPEESRVDITIQTNSLDSNNAVRDEVLRSDDFFDGQQYPNMRFVSRRVAARSDGTLAVTGDLTIHGITKPIDVIVTVNGTNTVANVGRLVGFETTFHIDRTAFGVNGSRWSGGKRLIAHDVEVHLAIAAADRALYGRTQAPTGRMPSMTTSSGGQQICGRCEAPAGLTSSATLAPVGEPGEPVEITGRIVQHDGARPAPGAVMFVYQTDATGHYNPEDDPFAPRLRGWVRTGSDGRYRIRTIRPAAYPDHSEPAHMHIHVWSDTVPEHFVHETWLDGDPLIKTSDAARLKSLGSFSPIVTLIKGADGVWRGVRDVRLEKGSVLTLVEK